MTEIPMSLAEWSALPKDRFDEKIKSWCFRHKHTHQVSDGGELIEKPAKLPYRLDPTDRSIVLVDEDFYNRL